MTAYGDPPDETSEDFMQRLAKEAAEEAEAPRKGAGSNGHAGEESPIPSLTPINPTTLDGILAPLRQWIVLEWVPKGRVTALYGAGGEGKTLLAQMLATACAIGHDFLGVPTSHARSILLYCEDDLDEMHRRQEEINRHYGCTFADLEAMRWLPRLGSDNALMDFAGGRPQLRPLFDQLVTAARDHKATLVITDTLADVFSGNENDRGQARAFAQQALGFLARETQGLSLLWRTPPAPG